MRIRANSTCAENGVFLAAKHQICSNTNTCDGSNTKFSEYTFETILVLKYFVGVTLTPNPWKLENTFQNISSTEQCDS